MKNKMFFFLICLFAGCRKKDPDAISGTYLLPQELKDYTLFLPGTYWVYQDSITGVEDCVYVINCNSGIDTIEINSDNAGKEIVEYFGYEVHRTSDNATFYYSSNTSFSDRCVDNDEKRPCFWTNRDKYYPGNYIGGGFCFLYEFYKGAWAYSTWSGFYSKVTTIDYWSTLKLNNNNYSSVSGFHDDKNITESNNRTIFYFSKHIGIIRMELLDSSQTRNLIRFNVVQ
jgi:hypothetical protein